MFEELDLKIDNAKSSSSQTAPVLPTNGCNYSIPLYNPVNGKIEAWIPCGGAMPG